MKKASSSSKASKGKGKAIVLHEDKEPLRDIAERYRAPFPIFHEFEGERYVLSHIRDVVGSKFLPKMIIEKMGMTTIMNKLLQSIGLKQFVDMEYDSYVQLTQEFYCPL